jgi:MFS family permease
MSLLSILDRENSVAPQDFNRWLVPPAALGIHLCIGEVYAFSVFNLPLTKLIGITKPAPTDWSLADIGWIFSVAIAVLGLSAAFAGGWLERAGPRKAMATAAICFGGGFLAGGLGIQLHILALLFLGYGVLGGFGLGLAYISPVRTLMTWFPDRPGMATGLAIMGFGGGAMIASPLSVLLMHNYATPTDLGVAPTFFTLGIIYTAFMLTGAALVRVPAPTWQPPGKVAAAIRTERSLNVQAAMHKPQFYLIWLVLFLNVTAGIGVLSQASPMIQEMFKGQVTPVAAAGFVGLLSLFNMAGRFFWASISDMLGRKPTFFIFLLLGIILYASVPSIAHTGTIAGFVLCYGLIISMYGGGFSTMPVYAKDLFGTQFVGAIYGRVLTAWSAAGVLGPLLVGYFRQYQIDHGVPKADAYSLTMYIMAGLLLLGAVANALVAPVAESSAGHAAPAE